MLKKMMLTAAMALGVGVAMVAVEPVFVPHAVAGSDFNEDQLDELIMNNGKVIKGWILSETDREVRIRVLIAGIQSEATYPKDEIIKITRAEERPAEDDTKPEASIKDTGLKTKDGPASDEEDPDQTKFYVVTLKGDWGHQVSETPLRELFRDVDKTFDDKIERLGGEGIVEVVDPAVRDKHVLVVRMDTETDPRRGFDGIWRTEELGPIFEREMESGRRIVFWVKKAGGGAAFLPWISREIYFTPDGYMGGFGTLQWFQFGDEWVTEKQISLRLGHAEGFIIKGGYAEHVPLVRAMARAEYWLLFRWEGGRPVYLQDGFDLQEDGSLDGWEVLCNNKNVFDLNADWANKLQISHGTAATVDELAGLMGVSHNYKVMKDSDGQEIFADWRSEIDKVWEKIRPGSQQERRGTLWQDFDKIEVAGDYYDRKKARGKQLRILGEIRSLVVRYEELWDRDEKFRRQTIDVLIDQIKKAQQLDTNAWRRGRSGGGGGGRGGGAGGGR